MIRKVYFGNDPSGWGYSGSITFDSNGYGQSSSLYLYHLFGSSGAAWYGTHERPVKVGRCACLPAYAPDTAGFRRQLDPFRSASKPRFPCPQITQDVGLKPGYTYRLQFFQSAWDLRGGPRDVIQP